MDGTNFLFRRAALPLVALGVLALPLAGVGAQDASAQRVLVADIAVETDDIYRILGRNSVDIIKTGGEKVSALEIEEVLRTHPAICQCAVVGVEDDEWGERVAACLVVEEELTLETLRDWAKQLLAVYKVPSLLLLVDELPSNAMGKVQKPAIKKLFARQE